MRLIPELISKRFEQVSAQRTRAAWPLEGSKVPWDQVISHQTLSPLMTAGSIGPSLVRLIVAKRSADGGAAVVVEGNTLRFRRLQAERHPKEETAAEYDGTHLVMRRCRPERRSLLGGSWTNRQPQPFGDAKARFAASSQIQGDL